MIGIYDAVKLCVLRLIGEAPGWASMAGDFISAD